MDTKKQSYVYAHLRASGPRAGSIFYIGKGTGRRAWKDTRRNPYWKSTVEKYGLEVVLLEECLSDEEAFELESELVSALREYLCNLHEGGHGASSGPLNHMHGRTGDKHPMHGRKHTPEAKERSGSAMRGRTGEKHPMYGRTGEKAPMHGRTGEKNPMHGRTGEKHPMYGRTGDKHPSYGKKRTPEALEKQRQTRALQKQCCIDLGIKPGANYKNLPTEAFKQWLSATPN